MPSMTPMMSAIFLDDAAMSCIVFTTVPTTSPPLTAAADAPAASWLAWPAVSALALTVPESSSIDAAVCCRLLACSSVRWLRSALPVAICAEPVAIDSLLARTWPTICARLSFMRESARSSCAVSSLPCTTMRELRSPAATVVATSTARPIGPVIERVIITAATLPSTSATTTIAISTSFAFA